MDREWLSSNIIIPFLVMRFGDMVNGLWRNRHFKRIRSMMNPAKNYCLCVKVFMKVMSRRDEKDSARNDCSKMTSASDA